MKIRGIMVLAMGIAAITVLTPRVRAQAVADSSDFSRTAGLPSAGTTQPQLVVTYTRPTEKTRLRNYFFDAFGPYPIVGAALTAGINQAYNTPPDWKQGAEGYGKRVGSNFGIAAVSTTTRYGLASAFHEDTLYYRCECKGVMPRLGHAVISTFTARRGEDGHRVFSVPALVAPYAGTMTAVYVWYPGRYDARDGFRMGNYSLLAYAGVNVAREFIFGGPHSWLSRHHVSNGHDEPNHASNAGSTP